jgi:hypothetical protein
LLLLPPCLFAGAMATGLACDHPPNSSSCCTEKPPALEVVLLGLAGSTSPQPDSNPVLTAGGAGLALKLLLLLVVLGFGRDGAAFTGSGSGVAHASFESPHTLALVRLGIG